VSRHLIMKLGCVVFDLLCIAFPFLGGCHDGAAGGLRDRTERGATAPGHPPRRAARWCNGRAPSSGKCMRLFASVSLYVLL
jgi:hypothetical protein